MATQMNDTELQKAGSQLFQDSKGCRWEIFCDSSYYHLWAVRPIGDKHFSSQKLFHVQSKEEAEALKNILNESTSPTGDAVEALRGALDNIANTTAFPANEREAMSWIETAREIARKALSQSSSIGDGWVKEVNAQIKELSKVEGELTNVKTFPTGSIALKFANGNGYWLSINKMSKVVTD